MYLKLFLTYRKHLINGRINILTETPQGRYYHWLRFTDGDTDYLRNTKNGNFSGLTWVSELSTPMKLIKHLSLS